MLARTTKPPAPPTLTQQLKLTAAKCVELHVEVMAVIERYIDEEKSTAAGSGLPRGTIHNILKGRFGGEPFQAVVNLAAERPDE